MKRMLATGLATLISVSLAQPAFAAAARLDSTFGKDGKVLTNLGRPASRSSPA
jgi:hypothetical protein